LAARVRKRCQQRLDLRPEMLEIGRQRQPLAETLGWLVGREPGADGGDLEQDAARLAEVDRPEVEAVDDWRRPRPGPCNALVPCLVIAGRRGPGDVVDGPGAAHSGLGGRLVVPVEGPALLASGLVRVCCPRLEGE